MQINKAYKYALQANQKNLFSDLKHFPKNLKQRNSILFYFGSCLMALFVLFLIAFTICQYSIYELCHWLKPGKFTFSFAMYVFAMGWYLHYLKDSLSETTLKAITWMIMIIITLEIMIMLAQSWMASTSYLSLHVPPLLTQSLQEKFYVACNVLILGGTGIAVFIAAQFFKNIQLKPMIYLWSIRVSFVIFILSCFLGILMMTYYGQTNLGSSGLNIPFTQFSTVRSNLISMHFLGIHAIQIIPLITYYSQNFLGKGFLISTVTIYSSVCLILFLMINNFL